MASVVEQLSQPTFEESSTGTPRPPEERDDLAAVKTYRYLRLGMVMVVVALVSSVFIQMKAAGCWQGSISAYYYTPTRAIFVSGMVAIAVSLIVIKGSTVLEDLLLQFAGVMAPIVAFVPTTLEPACVPNQPLGKGGVDLPPDIVRDVHNNIKSLLIAGCVALGVAVLIFAIEQVKNERGASRYLKSQIVLLTFTGIVLALGWWLWASERILDMHGWSALAMFVFLGVAALWNGIWLLWINRGDRAKTNRHWKLFASSYIAVAAAMLVGGVLIKFVIRRGSWDHRTLVLEMFEIGLFGAMWVVQSVERWGKVLQAPSSTATSQPLASSR